MRLQEVLNQPTQWNWTQIAHDGYWEAQFFVNQQYLCTFTEYSGEKDPTKQLWGVEFGISNGRDIDTTAEGENTKQALAVMSTIQSIFNDFKHQTGATQFQFTAAGKARMSLYSRMLSRSKASYEVFGDDDFSEFNVKF